MKSAPTAFTADLDAAQHVGQAALFQACTSLWLATLSLMTAFMQTAAPAHRYLLARRIGRNFLTLREQECFDAPTRASFSRLASRWQGKADRLAPESSRPHGGMGLLQRLLTR